MANSYNRSGYESGYNTGDSSSNGKDPKRRPNWVSVGLWVAAGVVAAGTLDSFANDGRGVDLVTGKARSLMKKGQTSQTPQVPGGAGSSPESTASSTPAAQAGPVIVIDPGHSGKDTDKRVPVTVNGKKYTIRDHDWPNQASRDPKALEIKEVFQIGTCAGKVLELDGYNVVYTKEKASSTVSLSKRAQIANEANADLAVSIHNDHGLPRSFQAVYDQRGVPDDNGKYPKLFREDVNGDRVYFDNPKVANASAKYAEAIIEARSQALDGAEVKLMQPYLDNRPEVAKGAIWMVQELATVPWVYNEFGAQASDGSNDIPMSIEDQIAYATGLVNGIEAAIEMPGGLPDNHDQNMATLEQCINNQ